MVPNIEHTSETLHFNPLIFETVLFDENVDLNKNYFGDYLKDFKTKFFYQHKIISHLNPIETNRFSTLHYNIKSVNKNFHNFFALI